VSSEVADDDDDEVSPMATREVPLLLLLVVVMVLAGAGAARGFYLPGVAPRDFRKKDQLAVKVNQLSSIKTQLPYSYYSLPFCRPATIVDSAENLGEVLRGDRIENSLYVVSSTRLGSLNWCSN
jgi:transmembrane 9 superfamily protein 2/4